MPSAISMPRLGMTMEEGTVVQWLVAPGTRVERGQVVLVIESEKAEVEIEALASGVFRHSYVSEGETVPCGTLLGAITETADESFDADAFHRAENRPETPKTRAAAVAPPAATGSAKPTRAGRKAVAPAARALAKKLDIDPGSVPGSGPGGRVTREDVEAWAARRDARVVVAEGVSLEVLREGAGEPLLLIPGFGSDVSAFTRQIPVLAERFHVFGLNPRGVGHSDAPETERYDVTTAAADAAAVVDAAGGRAHVVGASLGSAVALELALGHPDKLRSLTLITPFVRASGRLLAVSEGWCRLAFEASAADLAAALLPWFFSSDFLADAQARQRTLRGLALTLARVPAVTLERTAAGMIDWSGRRAAEQGGRLESRPPRSEAKASEVRAPAEQGGRRSRPTRSEAKASEVRAPAEQGGRRSRPTRSEAKASEVRAPAEQGGRLESRPPRSEPKASEVRAPAELGALGIPTLIISAGEDLLTPDGAALAAEIPGARHVCVEGAGHAVAIEAADAVNQALLGHLLDGGPI